MSYRVCYPERAHNKIEYFMVDPEGVGFMIMSIYTSYCAC